MAEKKLWYQLTFWGKGRGGCAVSRILILIQQIYIVNEEWNVGNETVSESLINWWIIIFSSCVVYVLSQTLVNLLLFCLQCHLCRRLDCFAFEIADLHCADYKYFDPLLCKYCWKQMDIRCRFTTTNDTPTPDQNIKYGMNNALGGLRFLILVKYTPYLLQTTRSTNQSTKSTEEDKDLKRNKIEISRGIAVYFVRPTTALHFAYVAFGFVCAELWAAIGEKIFLHAL